MSKRFRNQKCCEWQHETRGIWQASAIAAIVANLASYGSRHDF
jgi:hypothetical protein